MAVMSLAEAAAALGISVETARRRIKSGRLLANRADDGSLLVTVPDEEDPTVPAVGRRRGPHPAAAARAELEHLKAMLDEIKKQRDELLTIVNNLQRHIATDAVERAELRRLLVQLQAQLNRVQGLDDGDESTDEPGGEGSRGQSRRPWWRLNR